jgi:protein CpxP
MKYTTRIVILTFAISGLLAGRNVLAKAADAAVPGKPESASLEPKKCDRWEEKEKYLDTLKADLKLDKSQEAAWNEWIGKIKRAHNNWKEMRKNRESWASLPALDRMEKMLAFSKQHIARQEARLAATKAFYATLSPEQRQTFDKDFKFEHHERFDKRWQQ